MKPPTYEASAAGPARRRRQGHRSRLSYPASTQAPATLAQQLTRQLPPPHPSLRACVIIPAKDEIEFLPGTLAAMAAQVDFEGRPLPTDAFEIIVLANNCTDHTAAETRAFAHRHPALALHIAELTLPPAEAHVGRARRLLMDAAATRLLAVDRPGGLIASTDADTQVAPDWLAATQAEIRAGADAVGSRILTIDTADPARRTRLRDAAYHLLRAQLEHRLDPRPDDP